MKKAESGKIQKEIGQRAKEKKPFDDLKQRRTEIEEEIKAAEPELERLEKELHQKLNRLGNIVHASVKGLFLFYDHNILSTLSTVSKDEDENEIVKVWPEGQKQEQKTDFKHHYEILEKLDAYDSERGKNCLLIKCLIFTFSNFN